MKVICIGGGASSFYFAAQLSLLNPDVDITILEQGREVMNKVRISGGGRCNVTHACFDPSELVNYYPRGHKELLGPFYHYNPSDTMTFFEDQGVPLKIESDGRIFPKSNSSESIISALERVCRRNDVQIKTRQKVTSISLNESNSGPYSVQLQEGKTLKADMLFIGAGSSKTMWNVLSELGHNIVDPVPSLFTFRISDERIKDLAGISLENVEVSAKEVGLETSGPLLITHKGMSGPAILKMSAWGARKLHDCNYLFDIQIDFIPSRSELDLIDALYRSGNKSYYNHHITGLPKRLHRGLLMPFSSPKEKCNQLDENEIREYIKCFKEAGFRVKGQNRFKEEFVTAGGVQLKEINFKNFSSKILPNCYLCGEVLNIDGVTGGFNFQACWTGATLAARDVANKS